MFASGDLILHQLSLLGECSWSSFKTLYEGAVEAYPQNDRDDAVQFQTTRSDDMRVLDMLGFVEVNFSYGAEPFYVCPPVLYTTTFDTEPIGILSGARIPGAFEKALSLQEFGIEITSGVKTRFKIPHAIHLKAESAEVLEIAASELGCSFSIEPSISLSLALPNIREYMDTLEWRKMASVDFDCTFFSPEKARFVPSKPDNDLILIKYADRSTGLPRFLLWDHTRFAQVDPDWGRWIAAANFAKSFIEYDRHSEVMMYPRTMPLPKLYARAFALATATPPRMSWRLSERYYSFADLPFQFVKYLALKLGQTM